MGNKIDRRLTYEPARTLCKPQRREVTGPSLILIFWCIKIGFFQVPVMHYVCVFGFLQARHIFRINLINVCNFETPRCKRESREVG